jgi:hypothetical protein
MKYAVQMGSVSMTYIPSFIKIRFGIGGTKTNSYKPT